jgi:large subunit ribosomal protein L6
MPIDVPAGVTVTIDETSNHIAVKGPKGQLERIFHADMTISLEDKRLVVSRPSDGREHRALHGLTRALLANMVRGVSEGFTRRMQVQGVGYRVDLKGAVLVLNVGYSHPVEIVPPPGITFNVDKGGRDFQVLGIDKELVGQVAAKIRAVRKPEPYKGKGVRYAEEFVRLKAGKAGKAAAK